MSEEIFVSAVLCHAEPSRRGSEDGTTSRVMCGCEWDWCGAADATLLIVIRENRQNTFAADCLFPHAPARLPVILYFLPLDEDRARRRQGLVLGR